MGVARDSNYYRLSERQAPCFYVPLRQVYRPEFLLTFFVRTSGSTDAAIAALRQEARLAGSSAPLFNARSLSESIAASTFRGRTAATLLSRLAAGCAVLIAVVATTVPALRALRVDPVSALRYE